MDDKQNLHNFHLDDMEMGKECTAEEQNALEKQDVFLADLAIDMLAEEDARLQTERQIASLYELASDLLGSDRLVLRAAKMEALPLLSSDDMGEKLLGLQKVVLNNPTLDHIPQEDELQEYLDLMKEELAEQMARRVTEEQLENLVNEKLQDRQEEYLKEVKLQVLQEKGDPETPKTLHQLEKLEKMEHISLAASAQEVLRPHTLQEIIGQSGALKALLAKIATPFPQHVILYGPPGVGKTSAARLVLEEAKKLPQSPFAADAPFVEVDGNTLRFDPRDITNPLIGSVHDPIYQGASRNFADTGIPEPKLGLVSEAHGGMLFIDEIGEMDPLLLNKLLKVLEDKRVNFESSYYDETDPLVPKYIKQLFEQGAPADFVLVGATTRAPEEINPAIRSRCAELFFEPLFPEDIASIVRGSAEKLQIAYEEGVPELISRFTIEGRKANGLLADAYGLALLRGEPLQIRKEDIYEMVRVSRLSPNPQLKDMGKMQIGRVFGLGVAGFVGSVIEIEAAAFPLGQKEKKQTGQIRFNETAGSMAKDSVFNAAAVFRKLTGQELADYDLHVNVVGGGNIDGPSAGLAFFLSIYSAILQKPLRQDVAMTGEISITGLLKPVGGIPEKIYGARQAGCKTVIVPKANAEDVPQNFSDSMRILCLESVEEALPIVLGDE